MAISQPSTPPLVSREATQAKLDRRSAAAAHYRASQTDCIAECLEAGARAHRDRPALQYGGSALSYAELNAAANRAAHALHAQGVRRGEVVALCLENRPAFFEVWLGLMKLGAIAVFLNTNVRGKPLAHELTTTGVRRVVVG
ncbi:MAG TPA: AMP-binding protein, partial [Rhodanobacter sp.]|nr:AMP-binding protein [Rhodanobacter sp.]